MQNKIIATVMTISGLLTLTMLQAVVMPVTATETMFGETPEGAWATIVAPNWGALIGFMGVLLLFGAFNPGSRRLCLAIAGASKIVFIALVLSQGERYLKGAGLPVAIDSVMVVLFAIFLVLLTVRRASVAS